MKGSTSLCIWQKLSHSVARCSCPQKAQYSLCYGDDAVPFLADFSSRQNICALLCVCGWHLNCLSLLDAVLLQDLSLSVRELAPWELLIHNFCFSGV